MGKNHLIMSSHAITLSCHQHMLTCSLSSYILADRATTYLFPSFQWTIINFIVLEKTTNTIVDRNSQAVSLLIMLCEWMLPDGIQDSPIQLIWHVTAQKNIKGQEKQAVGLMDLRWWWPRLLWSIFCGQLRFWNLIFFF